MMRASCWKNKNDTRHTSVSTSIRKKNIAWSADRRASRARYDSKDTLAADDGIWQVRRTTRIRDVTFRLGKTVNHGALGIGLCNLADATGSVGARLLWFQLGSWTVIHLWCTGECRGGATVAPWFFFLEPEWYTARCYKRQRRTYYLRSMLSF